VLFSPEVPSGPFRTCALTTEAATALLHPPHVAPARPTVAEPSAKAQDTAQYLVTIADSQRR